MTEEKEKHIEQIEEVDEPKGEDDQPEDANLPQHEKPDNSDSQRQSQEKEQQIINTEPDAEQNSKGSQEVLGTDDEGLCGRIKKKRKLRRFKKKKAEFSMNASIHLEVNKYDPLKDTHLKSFFVNDRVRRHLRKQYLITKEGYLVEKPEEY